LQLEAFVAALSKTRIKGVSGNVIRPFRSYLALSLDSAWHDKNWGYSINDRVFHQKFGCGEVVTIDANKLTVAFDTAGEKRVVDSFVEVVV
jgi:hypothetical protein